MSAAAVEIVTVGNELLRGDTVDGNAAWLGRHLAGLGIRVARRSTVGDETGAIQAAVSDALLRTGTVLCTGGLGPTSDDLTRPAIAALYARALYVDADVLGHIRKRFEARGIPMPASNRVQAEVPAGAHVFLNPAGTAPGLALDDPTLGATVLLPGVPFEMRALMEHGVTDWLRARWPALPATAHRVLRTTGISESGLYDAVRDLVPAAAQVEVAFLPSWTGVDVRLSSATDDDRLRSVTASFAARLDRWIYTRDERDLALVLGVALRERGLQVAVAESCTGGLVAKRLTDAAGASDYFHLGLVAYHNDAKQALLGVEPAVLRDHGAVSEQTARAMVAGARRAAGAGCGIAITGVAGPGGGSDDKPVGTVWVAAATPERESARSFRFPGGRDAVRAFAAQAGLRLLHRLLTAVPDPAQ